ncbi:Metal tolerance protein 10 [Fusarium oxysporum f. sp. albedinis]|nr:Metal tolerance protein 10 [Fusarium oxysporum f. sp. albedinis]
MRKSIATRPSGMSVMIYSHWFIFVDCTLSQSFLIDDEPQNDPSIHSPTAGADRSVVRSSSAILHSLSLRNRLHCQRRATVIVAQSTLDKQVKLARSRALTICDLGSQRLARALQHVGIIRTSVLLGAFNQLLVISQHLLV